LLLRFLLRFSCAVFFHFSIYPLRLCHLEALVFLLLTSSCCKLQSQCICLRAPFLPLCVPDIWGSGCDRTEFNPPCSNSVLAAWSKYVRAVFRFAGDYVHLVLSELSLLAAVLMGYCLTCDRSARYPWKFMSNFAVCFVTPVVLLAADRHLCELYHLKLKLWPDDLPCRDEQVLLGSVMRAQNFYDGIVCVLICGSSLFASFALCRAISICILRWTISCTRHHYSEATPYLAWKYWT